MWMGSRSINFHSSPLVSVRKIKDDCVLPKQFGLSCSTLPERCYRMCKFKASMVDSSESSSSSGFTQRMELAWSISEQPRPVGCSSCDSKGHVECKWCNGTGFFIIGDNMLCEVESKNTSCIICNAKGSMCCSDCKGTGFRAKWLEEPPISNQ